METPARMVVVMMVVAAIKRAQSKGQDNKTGRGATERMKD